LQQFILENFRVFSLNSKKWYNFIFSQNF
jgi:hypothetical protein